MVSLKPLLNKFLIWRYKHISERQFIYILSIIVGFLAGIGTVLLKNFTHYIQLLLDLKLFESFRGSLYFILPIIGLVLVFLIKKRFLKKQFGHGIPDTLYAISKKSGIIEGYKIFSNLILAPITAGFGGSVGLQGPAVSTGAAFGSNVAQLFHMDTKTRMLLIGCAAAGAMASMFKAPIAALIFAMEIFSLDLAFASLVPLLLASVAAVITSYFFTGTSVLFSFELVDKFEISDILFYVVLGLGTGIASVYFSKIYFSITRFFNQFKSTFIRLIIGAFAIGVMLYFIPPLYGEGYGLINNLLKGDHVAAIGATPFNTNLDNVWVVIALLIGITIFKAIAMTTSFAAGGVGGIFIPTLVMGSALGNVFAKIINNIGLGFHVSESNFTLIGMTGLMAGVLHAPLTAIFLIAEITGGYDLFVPLMIVAAISFALTRYFVSYSIYTLELAERGELLTHDKDKNTLLLMDLDTIIETDFIAIQPEMKLREVLQKAVAQSNRNIFPVVNAKNEFKGVLLLDDIRKIMFDPNFYDALSIRTVMQNAPDIIFYEKDDMQAIMDKFESCGAWNLPVIKNNTYYGFISKSKMLTAYRKKLIEVSS